MLRNMCGNEAYRNTPVIASPEGGKCFVGSCVSIRAGPNGDNLASVYPYPAEPTWICLDAPPAMRARRGEMPVHRAGPALCASGY